ncbi:MAG: hypothetical protein LBF97_07905 [Elusimicrobiota bacterium]|nr:hypothetical protein [Elusimicrobiota bacterium]
MKKITPIGNFKKDLIFIFSTFSKYNKVVKEINIPYSCIAENNAVALLYSYEFTKKSANFSSLK